MTTIIFGLAKRDLRLVEVAESSGGVEVFARFLGRSYSEPQPLPSLQVVVLGHHGCRHMIGSSSQRTSKSHSHGSGARPTNFEYFVNMRVGSTTS